MQEVDMLDALRQAVMVNNPLPGFWWNGFARLLRSERLTSLLLDGRYEVVVNGYVNGKAATTKAKGGV